MKPPAVLWRCEHTGPADLVDLTRAIRAYLTRTGAPMSPTPPTPLESVLDRPLSGVEYTLAVAAYVAGESPHDDPDAPLTPEERQLVAAQDVLFACPPKPVQVPIAKGRGWELG